MLNSNEFALETVTHSQLAAGIWSALSPPIGYAPSCFHALATFTDLYRRNFNI